MEICIDPSDLFVVPFESTKAVRSYANFYHPLTRLRPGEAHGVLHVLSNLSRQPGLRRRVIEAMGLHGITPARTEVRTCGWLAQMDENGGASSTTAPTPRARRTWRAWCGRCSNCSGSNRPPGKRHRQHYQQSDLRQKIARRGREAISRAASVR